MKVERIVHRSRLRFGFAGLLWPSLLTCFGLLVMAAAGGRALVAAESRSKALLKMERFDRDPGWEGRNNRAATPEARTIVQDFGFSATSHAGGTAGEIGGLICPAAEPAYYAKRIPSKTFSDPLTASGKLACASRHFHTLVGFFNTRTINEWRTPNTIVLRLYGRGDVFYAYLEYATGKWRAGGGDFVTEDPVTGKTRLFGFPGNGVVHTWSLKYEPDHSGDSGIVTATIDGKRAICRLAPGHRGDGATFNRFGLLNVLKSADDPGEIWLDDLTANGQTESFQPLRPICTVTPPRAPWRRGWRAGRRRRARGPRRTRRSWLPCRWGSSRRPVLR